MPTVNYTIRCGQLTHTGSTYINSDITSMTDSAIRVITRNMVEDWLLHAQIDILSLDPYIMISIRGIDYSFRTSDILERFARVINESETHRASKKKIDIDKLISGGG